MSNSAQRSTCARNVEGAGRRPRGLALAWGAAAVVLASVGAGPFRRETDPASNPWLAAMDRIKAVTPPDSLIVVAGTGAGNSFKAYIPYFTGRPMLVLDWRFADRAVPPGAAIARLRAYLRAVARDRRVYFVSDVFDPALDEPFRATYGVTPAMRRSLAGSAPPLLAADLGGGFRLLRPRE